jgi:glycerol-3-phosphate dehydrogenase (NAD(P)+)
MSKVAVIGAGAWGTALSVVLGRQGTHAVKLWAFEPEVCQSVAAHRTNDLFLPGAEIPPTVTATNRFDEALEGAEYVVSVMPSHHCRSVFRQMAPLLHAGMLFVSATKGIENDSLLRMDQVITEVLVSKRGFQPRIAALSGPSFAKEVTRGDPTAVTVASPDQELARAAQELFSERSFRVYTSDDIVGVQLGGALKNVIAIAAGACEGVGLGFNSVAALITRGLAEVTRLVVAAGGRPETMAGLAGMGDLVLTCTGGLSRNRTVGVEMGHGRKLEDIVRSMHGMVAEGVLTTIAARDLARKFGVEMPITEQVYALLKEGRDPHEAVRQLMARPSVSELNLFRN